MGALTLTLWLAAYLYAFWLAYIIVMGLYRAHLAGRLTGVVKWLAYPIVAVGIALDVVAQYTIATVFFLDLPAHGEHLVTARLQRYIASRTVMWRYKVAIAICDNLLDVFDVSGNHC